MGRLRVCQLITELRPAGAERCVYELATRLDRGRFEVHVAALRGGEVADALARAGVPVMVLGVRSRLDLGKLAGLARFLRQGRFDLLHTHLFHADLAGRLAARRAGVGHLVHSVHIAEKRFRPWQYAWAHLAAGWCDRIVCVSQAVRDHHARRSHLPPWRYQVIHNGIDADAFARDPARRDQLRRQWGVADGDVLVAFVGRLDRQKNVGMLLRAAAGLRARREDLRLVLAGDGPERGIVEDFLRQGDHARWARWLGFTHDVPGVLSAADLAVLPSRWEGFGLAAAEAMAAGLPVIGTRVEGLSEVIEDGATGLLVASEDVNGLAAAVARLTDDLAERRRFGLAGRQRVRERFTIAANVAAHERLYLEVCGRIAGD